MAQIMNWPEQYLNITGYYARHSFAHTHKMNGTKLEIIRELLGHKKLETTETYLGSFENHVKAKVNANLL